MQTSVKAYSSAVSPSQCRGKTNKQTETLRVVYTRLDKLQAM